MHLSSSSLRRPPAVTRLLVAVLALSVAPPALAQAFGGGSFGAQGLGAQGMAVFDKADSNHDGIITRSEFITARNANFSRMDRNNDGVISNADFARLASFRPQMAEQFETVIARADTNGDGKVTRGEYQVAPIPLFELADTNQDGNVTKAELDAFKAAKSDGAHRRAS